MTATQLLHRHQANALGLGSVQLFRMGIRDGLDVPAGDPIDVGHRSFALGVAVGVAVGRRAHHA